jgi:hypothetical protein
MKYESNFLIIARTQSKNFTLLFHIFKSVLYNPYMQSFPTRITAKIGKAKTPPRPKAKTGPPKKMPARSVTVPVAPANFSLNRATFEQKIYSETGKYQVISLLFLFSFYLLLFCLIWVSEILCLLIISTPCT